MAENRVSTRIYEKIPQELKSICDICQEEYDEMLSIQEVANIQILYNKISDEAIRTKKFDKIPTIMGDFIKYYDVLSQRLKESLKQSPEMQFLMGAVGYFCNKYNTAATEVKTLNVFFKNIIGVEMSKNGALNTIRNSKTEDAYWFLESRGLNE
jgi:hypothetical protein